MTPKKVVTLREICHLSRDVLIVANKGKSYFEFLEELTEKLLSFIGCSAVELMVAGPHGWFRWEVAEEGEEKRHNVEELPCPERVEKSSYEAFCWALVEGNAHLTTPGEYLRGSFCHDDTKQALCYRGGDNGEVCITIGGPYRSLATSRFIIDETRVGLLLLKDTGVGRFSAEDLGLYEGIAQVIGMAIADRNARADLRERVKELTCLYGIARVVEKSSLKNDSIFQDIVTLLPPAMQFPQTSSARIIVKEKVFEVGKLDDCPYLLEKEVLAGGLVCGKVVVGYEQVPRGAEAKPFLSEESTLLEGIAREVSNILVRRKSEVDREKLQDQLRHADRLATIGQLAAGVAHELNEPLGSILGFAQLTQDVEGVPQSVQQDVEKIVSGALYAREVIRKLMLFARQMPPKSAEVDLNQLVEEGLDFFDARCAKGGIQLIKELGEDIPTFTGDPAQVRQVLVNLVVNAVQAMPQGGPLVVTTKKVEDEVRLIVKDRGMGMDENIRETIFLPFFTTKDVDEGTGLGLAVVHGIVTAHRGVIEVDSEPNEGSTFTVRFPVKGAPNG